MIIYVLAAFNNLLDKLHAFVFGFLSVFLLISAFLIILKKQLLFWRFLFIT